MKKLAFILLSLIFLNLNAQKFVKFTTNGAFETDESLQYSLHYNLYLDVEVAGFILKVEDQKVKDKILYGLTAYGETYNYSDNFLKIKAGYQSIVDKKYFLPRLYLRSLKHNENETKKTVVLSHSRGTATTKGSDYKAKINPNTMDLLSMFYFLRTLDLKGSANGSEFWVNTLFTNKIWNFGFKKVGTEDIKTKFGTVSCIVLQPILTDQLIKELNYFKISGDKPVISSDEQIKIWFTNDSNKVPVKIESVTDYGSIVIDLKRFEGLKNKSGLLR